MESHDKVVKTEEEWKAELSQEQYYVCRQAGTERPFDNAYWDNHEKGTYYCVACGQALFKSDTKFESGSGWPSFFSPFSKEALIVKVDRSHGRRARRWNAANATPTSATSSRTAPNPRVCATA